MSCLPLHFILHLLHFSIYILTSTASFDTTGTAHMWRPILSPRTSKPPQEMIHNGSAILERSQLIFWRHLMWSHLQWNSKLACHHHCLTCPIWPCFCEASRVTLWCKVSFTTVLIFQCWVSAPLWFALCRFP